MVIIGIFLILFGGLVTFANWRLIYQWYRYKRSSSQIPLMGGLSLALGMYCIHPTIYAFLAMLVDPGTLVCLYSIPMLIRYIWKTYLIKSGNDKNH